MTVQVITTDGLRVEFTNDELRDLKMHSDTLRRLTFHMAIGWVREMYFTHALMGRIMTRAINRATRQQDLDGSNMPESA